MTGNLFTRLFARHMARRRYYVAQDEGTRAWSALADRSGTAVTRWEALSWVADCERTMAATAFGFADRYPHEYGERTLAQAHSLKAELLELVADTELAPMPTGCGSPVWRWRSHLADDPAVSAVLVRLARETTVARRAELTFTLHDVLVPVVGARIAEVVAWVAHSYLLANLATGDPDRAGGDR